MEPGRHAKAVKCVTLGEPFLRRLPAYPGALVLEALVQTGGLLTRAKTGFMRRSILGKIERAVLNGEAHPGDTITLDVEIVVERTEGNLCEGVATVNGKELARARFLILFVSKDKEPPPDPAVVERRERHIQALGLSEAS
jgi:3-hydroxymyristoyl/3-hydroxydecanoyl-(acyl carrier protein) dehydratase